MKLLLTSGGLMNKSIVRELKRLAKRPMSKMNIAFIPTASNVEDGDKRWFGEDFLDLMKLRPAKLDIVDISAIPRFMWERRLKQAHIIFVEGGNTFHLMAWIRKSGLDKLLPKLLRTRVYIGVSAGSIAVNPTLKLSTSEKLENVEPVKFSNKGLGYVDFGIRPHINSKYFPQYNFGLMKRFAKRVDYPFYAIDDQTAISVDGKKIKVISEGKWKLFNAEK